MNNLSVKKYFDQIANSYLKNWQSEAKQAISNFELNFIHRQMKKVILPGKISSLLEIGFGPGRISEQLLKYEIDYYGIDISQEMLSVFKKKFGANKKVRKLAVVDISQKDFFKKLKFDAIVAMRVLYYLRNWSEVVERLSNKLNPGGVLVFCMLNSHSTAVLGRLTESGGVRGHFTSLKNLRKVLDFSDLDLLELGGFARLPDIIYDFADGKYSSRLLLGTERALRVVLGPLLFSRMFYVVARKKESK